MKLILLNIQNFEQITIPADNIAYIDCYKDTKKNEITCFSIHTKQDQKFEIVEKEKEKKYYKLLSYLRSDERDFLIL